jgi:hypothetical protein
MLQMFSAHQSTHSRASSSLRSPLNGAVYTVVPGRFILFRAPVETSPGRLWVDESGERRFSADFYAELLHDLGVTQVRIAADD